jgi:hypothetical protein
MNANDLSVCVLPKMEVAKLQWFTFHQNNSGGRWVVDNDVDAYVIVQAHNADEANQLAQRIGIYFNGVEDGTDCECCGDRWSSIYRTEDGTDVPMVYSDLVPWSPETKTTVEVFGNSVKVYPYNIISNR